MKPIIITRHRASHEPTPAQIKAGNYAKRKFGWAGMIVTIENEVGSVRSGYNPDGTMWETRMVHAYGYLNRTEGVDGDHVDVFVGPNLDAPLVYVVHQRCVGDWENYDEDKCFIGFESADDAERAFLLNYDDPRFLGPMTILPVSDFVAKAKATWENPAMIKSMVIFRAS